MPTNEELIQARTEFDSLFRALSNLNQMKFCVEYVSDEPIDVSNNVTLAMMTGDKFRLLPELRAFLKKEECAGFYIVQGANVLLGYSSLELAQKAQESITLKDIPTRIIKLDIDTIGLEDDNGN